MSIVLGVGDIVQGTRLHVIIVLAAVALTVRDNVGRGGSIQCLKVAVQKAEGVSMSYYCHSEIQTFDYHFYFFK